MFLHFYFINIKKEKKNYLMVYKTDIKTINVKDINNLLYNKLNNKPSIISSVENTTNNINYYELFYIKQGLSIIYNKEIWNKLIQIYLNKIELQYLIDDKYIKNIYSSDIILYLIDNYQEDIKQFLIKYYGDIY